MCAAFCWNWWCAIETMSPINKVWKCINGVAKKKRLSSTTGALIRVPTSFVPFFLASAAVVAVVVVIVVVVVMQWILCTCNVQ